MYAKGCLPQIAAHNVKPQKHRLPTDGQIENIHHKKRGHRYFRRKKRPQTRPKQPSENNSVQRRQVSIRQLLRLHCGNIRQSAENVRLGPLIHIGLLPQQGQIYGGH